MAEVTSQPKTANTSDLTIQPTELKFRFELRKNIPVTLSLHNPGPDRVAFKVKTTSPKKYCVRPSSGLVEPGATKDVQVIMQAQREYPPSLADCKDKFLVQTVKVDSKVSDISPELFDATGSQPIKQSKLRVVLVGPPKPPSPVPEGVEEDTTSEGRNAFKENGEEAPGRASQELAAVTQERNRLRDTLAKMEKDKADIKKRLDLLQLQVGMPCMVPHFVVPSHCPALPSPCSMLTPWLRIFRLCGFLLYVQRSCKGLSHATQLQCEVNTTQCRAASLQWEASAGGGSCSQPSDPAAHAAQAEGRPRTAAVAQKSLLTTPFTLVHLLIVALLAFLLGHFL